MRARLGRVRVNFDGVLAQERKLVPLVLEAVKDRTIAWARSTTRRRLNPPTRRGRPWRPAHPEPLNWSDVSGQLAASYGGAVDDQGGDRWRLTLTNSAEHAVYVEARDGYAVIEGIIERDGPIMDFLEATIREVAPGWRVIR